MANDNEKLLQPIYQALGKQPTSDAVSDLLIQRIQNAQLQGIQELKKGIGETKGSLEKLRGQPKQKDLTALFAIGDILSGGQTNYAQLAQAFKPKDTSKELLTLEQLLAKQRADLSDAELDLLKQQFQAVTDKDKLAEKKKGKQLTASATEQLADLSTQVGSLDNLFKEWETQVGGVTGVPGYLGHQVSSWFPNTQMTIYEDSVKQKAQIIGKALEGGKLSDVDYTKYIKFLPQVGDTKTRAKARIDELKKELTKKYNDRIKVFGQAGYDIEGFETLPGVGEKKKPALTEKDIDNMSVDELRKAGLIE